MFAQIKYLDDGRGEITELLPSLHFRLPVLVPGSHKLHDPYTVWWRDVAFMFTNYVEILRFESKLSGFSHDKKLCGLCFEVF